MVGVLWAAVHGAVALALAGHGKPQYGTEDPRRIVDTLAAFLGLPRPSLTAAGRTGRPSVWTGVDPEQRLIGRGDRVLRSEPWGRL